MTRLTTTIDHILNVASYKGLADAGRRHQAGRPDHGSRRSVLARFMSKATTREGKEIYTGEVPADLDRQLGQGHVPGPDRGLRPASNN